MSIVVAPLGIPVTTARLWTHALVPRVAGGWNWIGQFYNSPNHNPTEWVVMHVETGDYAIYNDNPYIAGKQGHFANSNFTTNNQRRAPNGRVFFPCTSAWNSYYDPTDEQVHDLGRIPNENGVTVTDALAYSMVFNHDGSKIYGGTVTAGVADKRPAVYSIDPVTLAVHTLCRVGSTGRVQNGYAYYLHADGDYLYVLVGQQKWDIVSVRISTHTATTLATETVNPWAFFVVKPEGLTAQLISNYGTMSEVRTQYWLIDGALVTYVDGYDPLLLPFTHRDVTEYVNPTVTPPQIDATGTPKQLRWRDYGSTGPWNQRDFEIVYSQPIPIESLLTQHDGSILGNVEQYQGFFKHVPETGVTSYYGPFPNLAEGNARTAADKSYISGYPNAPLYEYIPGNDWSTVDPKNPKKLGQFSDGLILSGVKRANVLVYNAINNRLYMGGLRERSGTGAGIGYYDFGSHLFAGHFTGLNFYVGHLGLAVFHLLSRVVFTGLIGPDPLFPLDTPTVAQLVMHDLNLNEIERQTPIPGLLDGGKLFRSTEPTVVIGISLFGLLMYRWDIVSKTLLETVDLSMYSTIGAMSQIGTNGTIVALFDTSVVLIDPLTLNYTVVGDLASTVSTYGAITRLAIGL